MAIKPFIEEEKVSAQLRKFAERLELARKEAGLTQKDLAEQCVFSINVKSVY